MGKSDRPWGAEETVLSSNIFMEADNGDLVVKKLYLDAEEMTPVERHLNTNTIIYVQEGAIDLQADDDFFELEEGDGHFLEAGTPHQIENLDQDVTVLLRISFPFDPDDVDILEDPYS